MPRNALPSHLQDFDWKGTDNASWLMRLKKVVQIWFAGSPRVPHGFFKFRDVPKTIFLLHGEGWIRYENTDGSKILDGDHYNKIPKEEQGDYYVSRIQPWIRWHIVLSWPFFFNWHYFYDQKYVIDPPKYESSFGIDKMVTSGIGYKRDGDKVYWPTMNGGGNFE